jgi:putative oxygen-independent coproporphyrinogen III oxidase
MADGPTPAGAAMTDDTTTGDATTGDGPLGIYIHWPFCRSLCPYCDFNSHVAETLDAGMQARWRDAFLAELSHYAQRVGRRRVVSIFFGGGTPSLMDPATAGALIDAVSSYLNLAPDAEITLEANPTSAEAGRFAGFAAAGVNRVSIGIQALDDGALAALGRRHSATEARAAIALAARHFVRYSYDLIYARPDQTLDAWRRELAGALALAGGHLSLYQLTIEAGTPFFLRHAEGSLTLPGESAGAAMYEATQEMLDDAGMPAYEISNHAVPGNECRHNLGYWRYEDYIGIGPGAHGRITVDGTVRATRQHRAPAIWLDRVGTSGHATQTDDALDAAIRTGEALMMGLRLNEGVDAHRFARRTGRSLESALDPERVRRLVDGGFLESNAADLRATPSGRQRLDAVLDALLA